ncbi:unnamed protein product [Brassica napus]|uniref:(rape) hypothetical protein n=1 Tax=Brassica napus TaxID=3708 RepID=A0A816P4Z6_BRANA|nr:unnamed protein product [Brassica napus]
MIGRADIEGSKSNVAMSGLAATQEIQIQTSFLPCCCTQDFCSRGAHLRTPSLSFNRCAAQPNSHLTMSSARIDPPNRVLGLKERVVTPPPIHRVIGLESSSTGSSFPADSAKPVPLAVVLLDSRQGQRESR